METALRRWNGFYPYRLLLVTSPPRQARGFMYASPPVPPAMAQRLSGPGQSEPLSEGLRNKLDT